MKSRVHFKSNIISNSKTYVIKADIFDYSFLEYITIRYTITYAFYKLTTEFFDDKYVLLTFQSYGIRKRYSNTINFKV